MENIKKLELLIEEKESTGKLKNAEQYKTQLKAFQNDVANFKRTY